MVKPTFLALSIAAACPSIVYATDSLNTAEQQDLATQLQQLKLQVEALESRLAEQAKQKTEAEIQQNTIAATRAVASPVRYYTGAFWQLALQLK